MLRAFTLIVMCFMIALTLQAADSTESQDLQQLRVHDTASTNVSLKCWAVETFELVGLPTELRFHQEGQTERWYFLLLCKAPQGNAAVTLKCSRWGG